MAASLDQITADALTLPLKQREQLIDRLVGSVDSSEGVPLSAEWEAEIKRRIQEIDNGAETIPADELFAEMRQRFGA